MAEISLMNLFELGTQRGNSRSKLNPKLKKRIFGYSQGLCVIDLVQTINTIQSTGDFLSSLAEKKRQVLLVGTSDHIKDSLAGYAAKFNSGLMPYINYRWLGGTLTNWSTIKKTLKTLEKLNNILENKEFFEKLSRNEQLNIIKQQSRVAKFFAGLQPLRSNRPGAVIVLDGPNNGIAIKEAESVGVPVIVLTNTSIKVLPQDLSHTITCNIHSITSVDFILNYLIDSYNKGFVIGNDKRLLESENSNTNNNSDTK